MKRKCLEVSGGAITFVLLKAVLRKLRVKGIHKFISNDFGTNRGSGNRKALGVAANDRKIMRQI